MLKTAWIATTNALFRKTGPILLKYRKKYPAFLFLLYLKREVYYIYA